MTLWKISEIKSALKDDILSIGKIKSKIKEVLIDGRKKSDNGLFIAIDGENNDGHNFLQQAFENGAVCALVEKIPGGFEKDSRLILVKNTIQSLNNLAIFARNRTAATIIGVTGSVGKTTVKEMLKTVFSTMGKTFATSGNLNNHFGLPLSLCNFPCKYQFGIFEMGMNHAGEIAHLTKIAKPHIAIISNVTSAHIGNFNNEEEIALAKSEIFEGVVANGYAIINNDSKYFELLKSRAISCKINPLHIFNFGNKETSDIRLNSVEAAPQFKSKIEVTIKDPKQQIIYFLNSVNEALIFNSLIVIAALKIAGKDIPKALEALIDFTIPKGRGNLMRINKNNLNLTIIDDSYNANQASMIAGLKFLSDLKTSNPNSRSIAVIGDMMELGKEVNNEHKAIAKYILEYNIDKVFLVGESMSHLNSELPNEKIAGQFSNSMEASEKILPLLNDDDILLIKGSRGMKMEKIIEKINS
jgi:UDP-N-acetylmuramoyl-tripeptide--D-alanyl-D-alanine ligase